MINISGKTKTGRRKNNQDTFAFFHNKFGFLVTAIADGMGGHKGGDVASKFAIDHIKESLDNIDFTNKSEKTVQRELLIAVRKIQEDFLIYVKKNKEYSDMGTTLNVNLFVDKAMYSLNIGDSRTSQLVKRDVSAITEDHNLAALAAKDPHYRSFSNYTNLLTSSLGPTKETKVDFFITRLAKKGYIIQTSDGVHNYITNVELKKILNTALPLDAKVDAIINSAYANGSNDNMTIMVIEYVN